MGICCGTVKGLVIYYRSMLIFKFALLDPATLVQSREAKQRKKDKPFVVCMCCTLVLATMNSIEPMILELVLESFKLKMTSFFFEKDLTEAAKVQCTYTQKKLQSGKNSLKISSI